MTLVVYAALGARRCSSSSCSCRPSAATARWRPASRRCPITICMIFLAAKGGELGARIGPRIPMTVGPIVMGAGCLLLLAVGDGRELRGSTCCPG